MRDSRIAAAPGARSGITLIELLVVLAIIGLLAALSLPAMKGIGQSNVLASATRQVLDDLSLARQLAINTRTTVCIVFVPTNIWRLSPPTDNRQLAVATNLTDAAYTTYAIFSTRTVGDQPGQTNSRYIRLWRSLPDGTMITADSFAGRLVPPPLPGLLSANFPYPTSGLEIKQLPYIGFNQNGSLVDLGNPDRPGSESALAIARGSIFAERDPGNGNVTGLDVQERPFDNGTNNIIRINGLTGRARLEQPQIK